MRFNQHRGRRVNHRFVWVKCRKLWWLDKEKKWVSYEETQSKECSTAMGPVGSVRAFRRRLKQWSSYLPNGTEITLVSRYLKCNVFARLK